MFFSRDNPVPYGPNTQLVTWNEALTIGCSFSLVACYLYMFQVKWLIRKCLTKFFKSLTKYLSVATDTRMASSPVRTFSPSDLCLEDGWIVHQQASPIEFEYYLEWGQEYVYNSLVSYPLKILEDQHQKQVCHYQSCLPNTQETEKIKKMKTLKGVTR